MGVPGAVAPAALVSIPVQSAPPAQLPAQPGALPPAQLPAQPGALPQAPTSARPPAPTSALGEPSPVTPGVQGEFGRIQPDVFRELDLRSLPLALTDTLYTCVYVTGVDGSTQTGTSATVDAGTQTGVDVIYITDLAKYFHDIADKLGAGASLYSVQVSQLLLNSLLG